MSSTWISAEIAARRALRRVLAAGGSPRVSLRLAAAACAFHAAGFAWAAYGSPSRSVLLRGSWSFAALALVVAADAALSVKRFLPPAWEAVRRRRSGDPWQSIGAGTLSVAYALLATALVVSWSSNDVTRVRLAVGEEYGDPEQVVGVDSAGASAAAPVRTEFAVDVVEPVDSPDGTRIARSATVVMTGGERVKIRRWRPLWLGASALMFPSEGGVAPKFELRDGTRGVLESAYAKVDVLPPGKQDVLTFEHVPHRVYLERASGVRSGEWIVRAYRGKLPLATGTIAPGEPLSFEGLQFVIRDEVPTVTLRIVRDGGIPFALASGLLALAGVSLARAGRSSGAVAAPPPGGPDASG